LICLSVMIICCQTRPLSHTHKKQKTRTKNRFFFFPTKTVWRMNKSHPLLDSFEKGGERKMENLQMFLVWICFFCFFQSLREEIRSWKWEKVMRRWSLRIG
jgi:hypothetical protein